MLDQWLGMLPAWLMLGVGVGAAASTLVAAVFLAANRWFPDPPARTASESRGSLRRRAEIRQYLAAIDERFHERYVLDGREVAFYLPERDVVITFDAQAYFRLRDAEDGRHVVLCEHEMPGHQLGRRLPFGVPDLDDGSDRDPVRAAFETLGLPRGADEDAVESAYRERVKESHPDRGGSREAFTRVREAYATALNHVENG
ncbi:J domain-containing protein [Halorarum halobium]|uniref:J domain-containing protein n=1 Tax=Halorarum halobium TaxID=3075121 RepID=UPI0028AF0BB9|nr:J domain-containing protein [Halobaculum sp. XH14]